MYKPMYFVSESYLTKRTARWVIKFSKQAVNDSKKIEQSNIKKIGNGTACCFTE